MDPFLKTSSGNVDRPAYPQPLATRDVIAPMTVVSYYIILSCVRCSWKHIHEPRFQRLSAAAAVRSATATVPIPGAHRPVRGRAHVAVARRVSAARVPAVRLGPVAVPERADRRARRHTHLVDAAHAARHRRAGAHRLQVRPRLTRARGPRAHGFSQRDRA